MRTSNVPELLLLVLLAMVAFVPGQARPVEEQRRELDTKANITMPPEFFAADTMSPIYKEPLLSYNSSRCSICQDAKVITEFVPTPFEELAEYFPPNNWTCGDWEQVAQEYVSLEECGGMRTLYPQCCDGEIPLYTCEANIRKKVLKDYDTAVPPIKGLHSPLDITVNFVYHAVNSIDVQAGTISLFFSIELMWKDERLKWDIGPETCADYISMYASLDTEQTDIWVPDMELYNQVEGIQQMPPAMAQVFPDGTVFWDRTGGLTAFCSFRGLSTIPFDVIGCQFIIGPWSRLDPRLIRYNLLNGTGLTFGRFQSTFNEYLPVYELAESGMSFGGALMFFNFYFKRSQAYYVFNLLVPSIILTYVSLGTFLLDLRVGERLSYGMALALVVVAQQIATGGMIPVSNERLWIDKFIGWSFYWVIFGLVESVFVGYVYFLREDRFAANNRDEIYHGMDKASFLRPRNRPITDDDDENNFDNNHERDVHESQNGEPPVQGNGVTNTADSTHLPEQSSGQMLYSSDLEDPNQKRSAPLTLKKKLQQHKSLASSPGEARQSNAPPIDVSSWKRWFYTVSLRKIDRFFFFFTLATYTLFIIAMFISRPYWGRNLPNPWANENTTLDAAEVTEPGSGF